MKSTPPLWRDQTSEKVSVGREARYGPLDKGLGCRQLELKAMELNCSIELIVDCGEGYDDQRVVKLA